MEILSFVLGMGVVLLIALAVGGVVALVKIGRLKTQVNISENNRNSEMQNVYRQFDDVYKAMDSRFDKMDNKFKGEVNEINLRLANLDNKE